jgi:hypothetical protein
MKTLDQICSKKVEALRTAYNSEEELRCRNCNNYEKSCYTPFIPNGEPVRKGQLCYILQKEGVI